MLMGNRVYANPTNSKVATVRYELQRLFSNIGLRAGFTQLQIKDIRQHKQPAAQLQGSSALESSLIDLFEVLVDGKPVPVQVNAGEVKHQRVARDFCERFNLTTAHAEGGVGCVAAIAREIARRLPAPPSGVATAP